MHRKKFLQSLDLYEQTWVTGLGPHASYQRAEEEKHLNDLRAFVLQEAYCFSRETLAGHVTGSCLIVSPDLDSVLLTFHAKLGKWLQLGGHCDGDPDVFAAAKREGHEESGLAQLEPLNWNSVFLGADGTTLFDIDIHEIPARKTEPTHLHYDARYLLIAPKPSAIQISEESKDLKWFPLSDAYGLTEERSMLRQFDKLRWLKSRRP